MSTPILPTPPAPASPWKEVATVYRRICLLRLRGLAAEAAQLETTALAAALAAAELAHATPAEFEQRMRALFLAEEERVHNAAILAELLTPLLATAAAPVPAPTPVAAAPARPVPVARPLAFNPAPTASEPDAIADFIEGMLDQQRAGPGR